MKTVRSLFHRLYNLFHKEQLDRDWSDELAAHLEMHTADNVREGMSWDEARRQVLSTSLAQQRMQTGLLALYSAVALLLGAIGLYGVLAYSVAERKRELAIRMALGAERGQILRLVIAHGLKLTLTGMVLGILCGLALARFMRNLLFGTSATDALTFAMVGGVLMLVAVAACWIPASRHPGRSNDCVAVPVRN